MRKGILVPYETFGRWRTNSDLHRVCQRILLTDVMFIALFELNNRALSHKTHHKSALYTYIMYMKIILQSCCKILSYFFLKNLVYSFYTTGNIFRKLSRTSRHRNPKPRKVSDI